MNYDPAEILAAQEHFGFARPAPIEKDWHILRAMGAIASALETEHHFAQRYAEFLQLMVYGVKPDFAEAMATIASLVRRL